MALNLVSPSITQLLRNVEVSCGILISPVILSITFHKYIEGPASSVLCKISLISVLCDVQKVNLIDQIHSG